MGDVVIRQGAFRAVGTEHGPGLRSQVQAGKARLLRRDPEERLLPVGQHTVQLVGRQAVRAFQERPPRDAVVAVQAFFRGHPDPVLRIDGDVDDESVGQTDLLAGRKGSGQDQTQEEKGSAHGKLVFTTQNKHFYDIPDQFGSPPHKGLTDLDSAIEQIADLRAWNKQITLPTEFG